MSQMPVILAVSNMDEEWKSDGYTPEQIRTKTEDLVEHLQGLIPEEQKDLHISYNADGQHVGLIVRADVLGDIEDEGVIKLKNLNHDWIFDTEQEQDLYRRAQKVMNKFCQHLRKQGMATRTPELHLDVLRDETNEEE